MALANNAARGLEASRGRPWAVAHIGPLAPRALGLENRKKWVPRALGRAQGRPRIEGPPGAPAITTGPALRATWAEGGGP